MESTSPGGRLRDSKLPIVIPFALFEVYRPPVIYYKLIHMALHGSASGVVMH